MYNFKSLIQLLPFFGAAFSPDTEIVLCDTEQILFAVNPFTERMTPGNPLGDMERSFLEDGTYETRDSVINYRALLPSRERLRSSTYFLKNEDGSLAGFLTIKIPVEKMLILRDSIDAFINGAVQSPVGSRSVQNQKDTSPPDLLNRYEGVTVMVEDIVHTIIDEYLTAFNVPAERLTSTERQKIVQELDRRGVFLVKGSITEVAHMLKCSEVTIYRYLQ